MALSIIFVLQAAQIVVSSSDIIAEITDVGDEMLTTVDVADDFRYRFPHNITQVNRNYRKINLFLTISIVYHYNSMYSNVID